MRSLLREVFLQSVFRTMGGQRGTKPKKNAFITDDLKVLLGSLTLSYLLFSVSVGLTLKGEKNIVYNFISSTWILNCTNVCVCFYINIMYCMNCVNLVKCLRCYITSGGINSDATSLYCISAS